MKQTILVINSGSSSVKFSLFDTTTRDVVVSGVAEELGTPRARITFKQNGEKLVEPMKNGNHADTLRRIFSELDARGLKQSVEAIGHRVAHGADEFSDSVLIDNQVLQKIEQTIPLAPLHAPANLAGIRAALKVMPDLPQVAVFDTAFHQTMPEYARRYAVPESWYDAGVRRYGFHGTSYQFVATEAAKLLHIPLKKSAFVIAHLGNGASLAAVLNGRSVDTTMGFTPLEGVPMGTRSGDIDPSVVPYMMERLGVSADKVLEILNKDSGHLGVSGLSSDFRDLENAAGQGNRRAQLAMEVFAFRVAKAVAAMMVSLPRVDALIFTAGSGERGPIQRQLIANHLAVFGYHIDRAKNDATWGKQGVISADGTPLMMVIPTNEELMIALDTIKLVNAKK